jgi:exosortase
LAVARKCPGAKHPGVTRIEAPRRLPTLAEGNLAALGLLAFVLVAHLWPEWTHDPDLSHGFLMPVVAVVLLCLGRPPQASGTLDPGRAAALTAALGLAALACLGAAGLFAATLDWSSPVVDFSLACAFALLGCAAVAAFASRDGASVPFNWTTLAAALLWPLCSPLPPGTYSRLTLSLQLWVSSSVMRALDLFGIAAQRQGNIIELARGSVGVEEACSGVRSLVSCIFAGVLFSAALCRRPRDRVLVVLLSVPLALAMNFVRSFLLTLLVNDGVPIAGTWHDATGYGVLVATAALLAWLAISLDRGAPAPPAGPAADAPSGATPRAQVALSVVVGLAGALLIFFAVKTSSTAPDGRLPVPDIAAMLPVPPEGWTAETSRDLYRFSGTLRTDHLAQRTYSRPGAGGPEQVTIYVAYWEPGQASVGLVGSHTPDACWPGAGWVPAEVPDPLASLSIGGRALPGAQHRLFKGGRYPQEVWYWQLYHGSVVQVGNPRSVPALIRIALRYGFRKGGEEAFIRISSNRPWDQVSREPFVAEFFGRARGLGLY